MTLQKALWAAAYGLAYMILRRHVDLSYIRFDLGVCRLVPQVDAGHSAYPVPSHFL